MRWTVARKIAAGFGLILLINIAVGLASHRSTAAMLDAAEWRRHTYEVLRRLDAVASFLQETEAGQRSYLLTGDEDYLRQYHAATGRVDGTLRELRQLTQDDVRQQQRLEKLESTARQRIAAAQHTLDAYRSGGQPAAIAAVKAGEGKRLAEQQLAMVKEMYDHEQTLLADRTARTTEGGRLAQRAILVGTLLSVIVAALAGFVIARNIAVPLGELTARAERITLGELDVSPFADGRTDEVGVLGRTFNRMAESLRSMAAAAERIADGDLRATSTPQSPRDVLGNAFARMSQNLREQTRQLVEGASVLGAAAAQIVTSTSQLAASAAESAAAVTQTTATVEEVRQTAHVASQKAQHVFDSARKAAQISDDGRKSTEDAGAGMGRIRQQMDAIAASMVRLSEQSQTIGQIIASVEDLAGQSNLLAVNAAVEAAKAGEHGRGFSVVAQEVKSLALQSRQATAEVRAILSDIQKATAAAVLATEQGTKAVEGGTRQTEVAGASIHALAGSVGEAAQAATQIAASSQQQLVGVDQVAAAMDSIKQASSQNVSSARQLEAAAHNLSDLGRQLKQMVERYTV